MDTRLGDPALEPGKARDVALTVLGVGSLGTSLRALRHGGLDVQPLLSASGLMRAEAAARADRSWAVLQLGPLLPSPGPDLPCRWGLHRVALPTGFPGRAVWSARRPARHLPRATRRPEQVAPTPGAAAPLRGSLARLFALRDGLPPEAGRDRARENNS